MTDTVHMYSVYLYITQSIYHIMRHLLQQSGTSQDDRILAIWLSLSVNQS